VMIVAALVTLLFHRLKQPVVLGYILAGLIIGPHTPPRMPASGTSIEQVAVAHGSPAERRMIRELQLRATTGASVVGIARGSASMVNPGPDEELLAGDQLLLLGTPEQLARARNAIAPVATH